MISTKQNNLQFYKYLKAQRLTYSKAKIIIFLKYCITILLVIFAPISFIHLTNLLPILGTIGTLWALISFLLGYLEKYFIEKAALIQEIIDTELFELDWNSISFGNKAIPFEYINKLTSQLSEIELEHEFKDWYEGIDGVESPLAILLCQRQNITWDYNLRNAYSILIIIFLSLVTIIGLLLFAFTGSTLLDYLIGLLLPSLSAYILGINEITGNFEISKVKKKLEEKIMNIVENHIDLSELNELREIQDVIYNQRLKTCIIPDLFYNILKKKYSIVSKYSVTDIIDRLS